MFTGPDWLKAHKGDLHGQDQADDVEGTVGWREKINQLRAVTDSQLLTFIHVGTHVNKHIVEEKVDLTF